jgi:hypothetical protein
MKCYLLFNALMVVNIILIFLIKAILQQHAIATPLLFLLLRYRCYSTLILSNSLFCVLFTIIINMETFFGIINDYHLFVEMCLFYSSSFYIAFKSRIVNEWEEIDYLIVHSCRFSSTAESEKSNFIVSIEKTETWIWTTTQERWVNSLWD